MVEHARYFKKKSCFSVGISAWIFEWIDRFVRMMCSVQWTDTYWIVIIRIFVQTPHKSTFNHAVCEVMHVCVVLFVGYLIWHFFWSNSPNFGMHRMKITAKRNVSKSQEIDLKLFLHKQVSRSLSLVNCHCRYHCYIIIGDSFLHSHLLTCY